jgi:hypothetical protein
VLQVTVGAGTGMRVCNPHSTRTRDMGLTGLPAFAGQCDQVTHSHTIPLAWFSPTTTSPPIPSCSQLQPTAHTCPSPLQRDVGWLVLTRSGGMAGRTQGGTQQVGGPAGVLREWANSWPVLAHSSFLYPN